MIYTLQGVLQQTVLFIWAGTQRVCMSHKKFLHNYDTKTWDKLLEWINPIWSHNKYSNSPIFENTKFSWLFLFIVKWEGWQGRTRLHTSRRCHFIIPRYHSCEFSAKKFNRNELSNISNLGHFAFHFIAIIWDFLYLVWE